MTGRTVSVGNDPLVSLNEIVRRVIAARVRDPHLIEDLTQETLVRVASAQPRLTVDALQAYAIVTARNVVISQARRESVHERHAHRLVDYTSFDGPENLLLEQEETDALATALERLDPGDRELLLRHEAEGVTTEVLAADSGTSRGAVAMRLARARAVLRVEFLMTFRRVELPTARCRTVLVALSAGDCRRQQKLGAADHLLRCATCAQLAEPVTERRRGIAAWLIVPAAEALRRVVTSLRRNRSTQIATAAATVAVAVGVLVLVAAPRSGDAPDRVASAGAPAATAEPSASPAEAPPEAAPPSEPPPAVGPASAAVVGNLPAASPPSTTAATADAPKCAAAAPLDAIGVHAAIGCPFAQTALTVTEVPADEGFWARTTTGEPVWVQLSGAGESPVDIEVGDEVVVVGRVGDPAALGSAADPRIAEAGHFLSVDYGGIETP